ncbi:cytochrome P450 [Oryctes borbonicus]|uniref:Cytochrome P450 n=1 Tax=Oryctes borbonicus TaxID=1629725 RepID=A0A0T6B7A5_9SCAR|nr:cytochrome P450 [Oryctes borbonicus]
MLFNMLVLPLVLVVAVWYLAIYLKWKKKVFDIMEKIPGQKWYPFIGTFRDYVTASRADVIYKFIENTKKYAPFYRSWNGNIPEIHVMKPDHIQVLLRNSTHNPKGPFYEYLLPWLGEGVLLSEGAKWFLQRKLLTPTFHFKILEGFTEIFGEKAKRLNSILAAKADGSYFNILPYVHVSTLETIMETSMGVPLRKITDKPLDYIQNVHEITEIAMWRYWQPWISDYIFRFLPVGRRHKNLLDELHAFSKKVVDYRKEHEKNNTLLKPKDIGEKKKRLAFIDLVLDAAENKNLLSDSDLQGLADTFVFAGFETTANTIGWILFMLGNHPQVQEKALQEVRSVLKGKEAPTTITELNELRYVDYVVKETLRLYPVVPFVTRTTTEDVEIDGYQIPAGAQAIVHIYGVHRDPDHYVDPEKFIPERFLPENAKARHPYSYIPFSAGPRNCLGMRFALLELRTIVASIVNKYKITSLHNPEEVKIFAHLIVRSQVGINVKLEKRETGC